MPYVYYKVVDITAYIINFDIRKTRSVDSFLRFKIVKKE